jgi:hypothetical protein
LEVEIRLDAFSRLLYPIAAVLEEGTGALWSDGCDGPGQGRLQLLDQAGFDPAQQLFELGPGLCLSLEQACSMG